jgi:crotonobetainyl-CoA:carnitine CoA-transferase CaiB-like acyl-CoA transferase
MVRMGADVVCVESTRRPDGGRATPAWFDSIHAGQRSVALDFRSPSDVERLHRLLASAEVVIEGSRPRALAQLGISSERLVANGPRVWVAITAHGRSGDPAMRVGYGDDAAAAGGLIGWVEDAPVFLADAVADPVSGLVAADAIVELVTAGRRAIVDVALSRVAASMASRHDDPIVAPISQPAAPRCPRPPVPPFVLGADTDDVLAEWT